MRGAPGSSSGIVPVLLLGPACFFVAACSPFVYKDDIASFSKGVDDAAAAFEALNTKALEKHKSLQIAKFARNKELIAVSPDCTSSVTRQLARDANCFSAWAAFRAVPEGKRGTKPTCAGASESVRGGDYVFYDLTAVRDKEIQDCKIGLRKGNGIDTAAIDDIEVLSENVPRLLPGLKGYAAALVAIADAADRAALVESIGKAKEQLTKLGTSIEGLEGKPSGVASAIGPVSDLVGTALVAILEQRRYRALVQVTAGADPVVTKAALILSTAAVPMTVVELDDAGTAYLTSFPGEPAGDKDEWAAAYAKARGARDAYLSLLATSPTPVFEAMADAHHELTLALADPNRQYEAVAAAVADFAEKAKAAFDAVEKAGTGAGKAQ